MRDYKQTVRELRDPHFVYHFSRDYLKNMMDDAADAIEELCELIDSNKTAVKHGRWEFETAWQYKPCDGRGLERKAIFGTTKRTFNRLKCSGCKKVVVVDDTIHYAYCPHCGAKMEPISASPENGQEVEA